MKHSTQITQWNEAAEQLRSVRTRVFVEEQKVPESLEWDEQDETAIHVLSVDTNGQGIATARLLRNGQIGRMAVLPQYRGQGLGHEILSMLLGTAKQKGYPRVFLHAQTSAVGFYEKHGFKAQGDVFLEANIPHQHMEFDLNQTDNWSRN